jgi:hypothetical protein
MKRIRIRGRAAVFSSADVRVTDPQILRSLDSLRYADEQATDYLGGTPMEDAVAVALEPGGILAFSFVPGSSFLAVETEFMSRRELTPEELGFLASYVAGQWEDGMGENWACLSESRCGFTINCLGVPENAGWGDYPNVVVDDI